MLGFDLIPLGFVVREHFLNIVVDLPAGTPIGTPEYFTDYVVTEQGCARLRGLTMKQRARALINISHPDFQDELERAAKSKHIL